MSDTATGDTATGDTATSDTATSDTATSDTARATCAVRVVLPAHLRALAGISREVTLSVPVHSGTLVTQRGVLDALEDAYPALAGTVRDRATGRRGPFIRFFACEEDLSQEPPDAPLPGAVACGAEPFVVLGAIAGGCT